MLNCGTNRDDRSGQEWTPEEDAALLAAKDVREFAKQWKRRAWPAEERRNKLIRERLQG